MLSAHAFVIFLFTNKHTQAHHNYIYKMHIFRLAWTEWLTLSFHELYTSICMHMIPKHHWTDMMFSIIQVKLSMSCSGCQHHRVCQDMNTFYTLYSLGPNRHTMTDFWEMIWQENVHCIVMATNLFEHARASTRVSQI